MFFSIRFIFSFQRTVSTSSTNIKIETFVFEGRKEGRKGREGMFIRFIKSKIFFTLFKNTYFSSRMEEYELKSGPRNFEE